MRGRGRVGPRLLVLMWAALCCGAAPRALTPQEEAGRSIFLSGKSPSGREISATLGAGLRLPASAVPCASCHGEDGLGRPEGGVLPPAITWAELTKPYGHVHPGGRKHPAFSDKSLALSITEGVDAGGNRLAPTMPRYSMASEDVTSLLAWMRRLDDGVGPGMTDTSLRLGVVLPLQGAGGEPGRAMRGVLEAYAEQLNASGGVHGRTLELVFVDYGGGGAQGLANLQRLVEQRSIFALLSGLVPDAERALVELAEREQVPLIGPLTLSVRGGGPPGRQAFFLLSDPREQALVLAGYAARQLSLNDPGTVILHPRDEGLAQTAQKARERLGALGWKRVELLGYERGRFDAALAVDLKRRGTRVLLFLGNDAELAALTDKARALDWAPYLLLPGTLSARAAAKAPALFQGRIFLAYPSLPSDEQPHARQALAHLRARDPAPEEHRLAQVSAYTAARLLTEGLRRCGRQLSRTRLLEHLEGLYAFETGLAPPLSYGPNRRVGALGAYVVTVDLPQGRFRPVTGWVALTEGP